MKENGLFTSDQLGLLRLHSTLTCLLKMSDDLYNGLHLGKLVGLAFIDLKKPFNTVDHDILCEMHELYGVQPREQSKGLGLTYPNANNSVGKMTLIRMSGKYKWESHRVHALALFSSSSISMISLRLYMVPL